MRSSFFAAIAFVTSSLASPLLKRAEGLKVSVIAPSDTVSSIDELVLTAAITNAGSEEVKILKYGTVLDALPTRSFTITKDDAAVSFVGVKLSVDLNGSNDAAFITIPAGETYTVTHELASIYDFESVGAGSFTITPLTDFHLVETDAEVSSLADTEKVDVEAGSITVTVSGDVARRHARSLEKKAAVSCSTSSRASFISSSYTEAKALASGASSYITGTGGSLFTSYYGTNSASTVAGKFNAVASESSSSRTLSCTDDYGVCDGNVIAYTVIATTDIYFCSIFFNEVASTSLCSGTTVAARNIRGGTTLHELTHAVADTDDVTYGCSADQALSNSNKLINADNYNCFSTQVYQNTQC